MSVSVRGSVETILGLGRHRGTGSISHRVYVGFS